MSEWRGDAHPILFYILLRGVARFGHSHLLYRSLSILPNVASVYLLGLVAQRTMRNGFFAPLTAAAFGFSMTIIDLACDVRGYSLALMFVIWAYYYLLSTLQEEDRGKLPASAVIFGVLCSLAILTEYYSVFFVAACWTTLSFFAASNLDVRKRLSELWGRARYHLAAAIALPLITGCWLYLKHLRYQPSTENNVLDFYWDSRSPMLSFITKGIKNDLNSCCRSRSNQQPSCC